MIKIYAIPVSLYCAKLRILLRHKNIEWAEILPPGGYGSAEYKTYVPSGNLPALVDGDLQLGDSEAIAEYLNEAYLEPQMLPHELNTRAKIRELSRFHDTRLEPALRKSFIFLPPAKLDRVALRAISEELNEKLIQLAGLIDNTDDIFTSEISLADCGFPITFAWLDTLQVEMGLEISWPKTVIHYRNVIESYPAIAAELQYYVPKLKAFLEDKTGDS